MSNKVTESSDQWMVEHLQVDNQIHAINTGKKPRFSWWNHANVANRKQSAYEIKVIAEDGGQVVWATGKVTSSAQAVVYDGEPLTAGTAYIWQLRTWNQLDKASALVTANFETGLSDQDWEGAQWLTRPLGKHEFKGDRWTLARLEVPLKTTATKRVRAYTAANHTYELFVEGTRVDRGPSFAYPGEGYYQACKLTQAVLKAAQPKITLGLKVHWYGDGQGRPAGKPGFLIKVVFDYTDGTRQVVVSDASWKVTQGPYQPAALRNGEGDHIEHYDATLAEAIKGWQYSGFDDQQWQAPTVIGTHPTAPFTKLVGQETRLSEQVIRPKRILFAADGTQVADFGAVYPARPRVRFHHGQSGRVIHLRAGYELDANGRVATDHVSSQGTDMSYFYTEVDGEQTYQAFTHLAFRYLELPDIDEVLSLQDIAGVEVHRAVENGLAAEFSSSSQILNQVWQLMARSALMGVQEQYVDTPTREKGQFLNDAANTSYATLLTTGERAGTRQAINEFLLSQLHYWTEGNDAGRFNAVYPNGDGKRDIPDYTEMMPDWVWQYYRYSGDQRLLIKAYPFLERTAAYITRSIATDGFAKDLIYDLEGGDGGPYWHGIVDWPEHGRFGYDMDTVVRTTVNALGVNVFEDLAKIAEAIGRPKTEIDQFTDAKERLVKAMNAKLRNKEGLYVDGLHKDGSQSGHVSQHANSYAIAFNVAPEADRQHIAEWLGKQGMRQGPMTAHWLLKALLDGGNAKDFLSILTNTDDFGWAQQVKIGRTFTPEAWHLSGDANSQSHGWASQAIVDIVRGVVGVQLGQPAGGKLEIQVPDVQLHRAGGVIYTELGPVKVVWKKDENFGFDTLSVYVPANAEAKIILPTTKAVTVTTEQQNVEPVAEKTKTTTIYTIGSGNWQFKQA